MKKFAATPASSPALRTALACGTTPFLSKLSPLIKLYVSDEMLTFYDAQVTTFIETYNKLVSLARFEPIRGSDDDEEEHIGFPKQRPFGIPRDELHEHLELFKLQPLLILPADLPATMAKELTDAILNAVKHAISPEDKLSFVTYRGTDYVATPEQVKALQTQYESDTWWETLSLRGKQIGGGALALTAIGLTQVMIIQFAPQIILGEITALSHLALTVPPIYDLLGTSILNAISRSLQPPEIVESPTRVTLHEPLDGIGVQVITPMSPADPITKAKNEEHAQIVASRANDGHPSDGSPTWQFTIIRQLPGQAALSDTLTQSHRAVIAKIKHFPSTKAAKQCLATVIENYQLDAPQQAFEYLFSTLFDVDTMSFKDCDKIRIKMLLQHGEQAQKAERTQLRRRSSTPSLPDLPRMDRTPLLKSLEDQSDPTIHQPLSKDVVGPDQATLNDILQDHIEACTEFHSGTRDSRDSRDSVASDDDFSVSGLFSRLAILPSKEAAKIVIVGGPFGAGKTTLVTEMAKKAHTSVEASPPASFYTFYDAKTGEQRIVKLTPEEHKREVSKLNKQFYTSDGFLKPAAIAALLSTGTALVMIDQWNMRQSCGADVPESSPVCAGRDTLPVVAPDIPKDIANSAYFWGQWLNLLLMGALQTHMRTSDAYTTLNAAGFSTLEKITPLDPSFSIVNDLPDPVAQKEEWDLLLYRLASAPCPVLHLQNVQNVTADRLSAFMEAYDNIPSTAPLLVLGTRNQHHGDDTLRESQTERFLEAKGSIPIELSGTLDSSHPDYIRTLRMRLRKLTEQLDCPELDVKTIIDIHEALYDYALKHDMTGPDGHVLIPNGRLLNVAVKHAYAIGHTRQTEGSHVINKQSFSLALAAVG